MVNQQTHVICEHKNNLTWLDVIPPISGDIWTVETGLHVEIVNRLDTIVDEIFVETVVDATGTVVKNQKNVNNKLNKFQSYDCGTDRSH